MSSRPLFVTWMGFALLAASSCVSPEREGDDDGECNDGADQDADGAFDCDDSDCFGSRLCFEADGDTEIDADTDTDSDTDTDTDHDCDVRVDETWPEDGADDFYWRAALELHLSDPDPTVVVRADFAGTSTSTDDFETVWFQPDAPLAPDTDYSAEFVGCFGTEAIDFRTSSYGAPLPDPGVLLGRTYHLDLSDARVIRPAGVGSVLTSYLTGNLLVGVTSADASALGLVLAGGRGPTSDLEQDLDLNTAQLPLYDFSRAPFVSGGPEDVAIEVAGLAIPVYDLVFSGTFAPDGSSIGGVVLSGSVDTRPLAPLLDDSADPGAVCDLALSFGAACVPCADDGAPYCLDMLVDRVDADEVPGVTIVPVSGGSGTCAATHPALPLAWIGLVAIARRRRRSG